MKKGLTEQDSVTRIPVTQFLPNEEHSTAILIVGKAQGPREIYLGQNELEIAGNLNANNTPLLMTPYHKVSEVEVTKFIDQVIKNAQKSDVTYANNPSHERVLPQAIKAAEQFYEVTDGTLGNLNNEPER